MSRTLKRVMLLVLLAIGLLTGCQKGAETKEEKKEKFPEFKTTDSNGNEVTEKIFADKDITMVNVWGTFCGPCINEMPELQKIYESLPKNANLIGITAFKFHCDKKEE